jgi:dipeptidase
MLAKPFDPCLEILRPHRLRYAGSELSCGVRPRVVHPRSLTMSRRIPLTVVLLALCCLSSRSWACYAVVVGRKASADGAVLVGHNEQNYGRRILNFHCIPRRQFPQDAVVRLRRGGEVEQVRQTWSFLWSENPGLEFSDAYVNEWGVAVVSDGCGTREDSYDSLVARGEIRSGGIGYMLRRLIAERAKSAREAVQLAGGLVERFGYVDSGRTYVIADPCEAWLLAVVRGRRWVAQRVPDDRVVILPNVHIIGEVDLSETANFRASPDLIDYAVKRGWFDPTGGRPFNFRQVYGVRAIDLPDPRRLHGHELVSGHDRTGSRRAPLSFGVQPRKKMTVASVLEILRDTSGEPPLCNPATQEGAVFQLREDVPREIGCVYWRTTAAPCASFVTPWYVGITHVPDGYAHPVRRSDFLSLAHHFNPPAGTFEPGSTLVWWKFKKLQDLVYEDFGNRLPRIRAVQERYEGDMRAEHRKAERTALRLWQTDREAARHYITRYCAATAARACMEANRLIVEFESARK